jgi:hypothetical protein
LRRGLALLLSLSSAEQETEQVFGRRYARRERKGAREHGDGNKHHAAPHALIRQLCTQRSLHPTPQNSLRRAVPQHDSH